MRSSLLCRNLMLRSSQYSGTSTKHLSRSGREAGISYLRPKKNHTCGHSLSYRMKCVNGHMVIRSEVILTYGFANANTLSLTGLLAKRWTSSTTPLSSIFTTTDMRLQSTGGSLRGLRTPCVQTRRICLSL